MPIELGPSLTRVCIMKLNLRDINAPTPSFEYCVTNIFYRLSQQHWFQINIFYIKLHASLVFCAWNLKNILQPPITYATPFYAWSLHSEQIHCNGAISAHSGSELFGLTCPGLGWLFGSCHCQIGARRRLIPNKLSNHPSLRTAPDSWFQSRTSKTIRG